jgi:class 3 adenylate cyclase/signal transduction histidine kinase
MDRLESDGEHREELAGRWRAIPRNRAALETDRERQEELDKLITRAPREACQRLATYIRRYMSPALIEELFEKGQLGVLMEGREVKRAVVIIADVRGFTPHTLDYEMRGRSLQRVSELLQRFFDDALKTIFEYKGVMGEFSGDKFMAIFGVPFSRPDDIDRAILAAIEIYDNVRKLNRDLLMRRQHHLRFDIGIGISTGGPVWIGDIGSAWRREWTMIGTTINLASRVEELTKSDEFLTAEGCNIVLTRATVDGLSSEVKNNIDLKEFPSRTLRGLGEIEYHLYKIIKYDKGKMPVLRIRIDSGTQAIVDAIAQSVESAQEREDTFRLGLTMQEIGQAISSSLNLDDILESVMDGVQRFLYATTASLLLIEEGTNHLRFKAVRPKENLPILQSFEDNLVIGTGIVGYVAETGESLCLPDAQNDPRFYSRPDTKTGFQTRSVLCAPIKTEDKIIGVIQVIDNQPGKFSQDDLRILEAIAAFAVSAIRNAQQYAAVSDAETVAAMGVLTSDMAHTIKSHVGLICWITESLLGKLGDQSGGPDVASLRIKLKRIKSNAEKTLAMMEEIRYPFSDLSLEKVDLRDLLESALESVLAKSEQQDSIIVERRYIEIPEIITDKARLSAVFVKVMENAIGVMESSSRKVLTIEMLQPKPSRVRVGISDTGPGIPPEHRAQLFRLTSKQVSEKLSSESRGWGYGLWSSRIVMRNLGGAIFLDEVYLSGTRMIIELPMESQHISSG